MATVLPDGVTKEMLDGWKERYGQNKVKLVTLFHDEERAQSMEVVARVPDRRTLADINKWLDKDPSKAMDIAVKACLLTQKELVVADDDWYQSACTAIVRMIPSREAEIKNL